MTTMSFPYLDSITHVELVALLKRIAKEAKCFDGSGNGLNVRQDQVAQMLGYKNWSLLHKHLNGLKGVFFQQVVRTVLKHKDLGVAVETLAVRTINVEDAVQEMQAWARNKYTPLIEFAFYDNESENGFGWPDVDMADELGAEFEGRYPDDLIREVGNDLDVDEGPWGVEDYGDD